MNATPDILGADILGAALRSDRFRLEREGDWRRLEAICTAMEKGRLRRLSDEDVLDLPVLYRTAASSLSIAREVSLDAATLGYLESLVQRAWFLVYGPRVGPGGWLRDFFGGGFSRAVRAIWVDLAICLAVMIAGTIAGWMLVDADPDWYNALVGQLAGERAPGASAAALRATLYGHSDQSGLGVFAAYLFGHNAQIALLCFALGFAFGLPSVAMLAQNTGMLGAMLWLFAKAGLLPDFAAWLAVHGTTELFALWLAGAAGLHIGRSVAFPGKHSVLASAAAAGRRAATVMVGVELMLLVAGLLEGFARQMIDSTPGRAGVGLAMLAFWLFYIFGYGRQAIHTAAHTGAHTPEASA